MKKTELTDWQKDALPMILERAKKAKFLRDEIRSIDPKIGLEVLSLTTAIQCYANEVAEGVVNGCEVSMTIKELADLVNTADCIRAKLTPQIPDWAEEYVKENLNKEANDAND